MWKWLAVLSIISVIISSVSLVDAQRARKEAAKKLDEAMQVHQRYYERFDKIERENAKTHKVLDIINAKLDRRIGDGPDTGDAPE